MCIFTYSRSLQVTWQRWQSHHSIRHIRKPRATADLVALCFIEPELWPIEVSHCRNRDCRPFSLCDLDLDAMTFIYEIDPYFLEIYRMCKYKLPIRKGFRKLSSDRQTRPKLYTCGHGWSKIDFTYGDRAYIRNIIECLMEAGDSRNFRETWNA